MNKKQYKAMVAAASLAAFTGVNANCSAPETIKYNTPAGWDIEMPANVQVSYLKDNIRISKQEGIIRYEVKKADKTMKVTVGPYGGMIPEGCTFTQVKEDPIFAPLWKVLRAKGDLGVLVNETLQPKPVQPSQSQTGNKSFK